jgi:peptidoglycan/LPS O-acetylase OafA/YrhL
LTARADRFPLFDSLRAIAALSIIGFHVAFALHYLGNQTYSPYLVQLNVGVDIFFVVSGFLLYRPFVAARWNDGPAPAARTYAVRRALRIVPAYWIALPLLTLASALPGVFSAKAPIYFGFLQVYSRSTMFGGAAHAWTLCIEVAFYAMLPLWALALRRVRVSGQGAIVRTELVALALMFTASVLWKALLIQSNAPGSAVQIAPALVTLPAYLDHFALGMALAVASVALTGVARPPRAVGLIERSPWVPWVLAAVLFGIVGQVQRILSPLPTEIVQDELKAFVACALVLPAVFGSGAGGWVRRVLSNRGLLWIGAVSYGVYLWQLAVMDRLQRWGVLDAGAIPFVGATIVLTLLIAAASYYLIERHAIRLGHSLGKRMAVPLASPADPHAAAATPPAADPPAAAADPPPSAVIRGG